jgi:hypothetical protein
MTLSSGAGTDAVGGMNMNANMNTNVNTNMNANMNSNLSTSGSVSVSADGRNASDYEYSRSRVGNRNRYMSRDRGIDGRKIWIQT